MTGARTRFSLTWRAVASCAESIVITFDDRRGPVTSVQSTSASRPPPRWSDRQVRVGDGRSGAQSLRRKADSRIELPDSRRRRSAVADLHWAVAQPKRPPGSTAPATASHTSAVRRDHAEPPAEPL